MPTITFPSAVRAKYEHKAGSTDGGELVGGDKTGMWEVMGVGGCTADPATTNPPAPNNEKNPNMKKPALPKTT